MHDDARARHTKMAPSGNPRVQRPGWVRGTREARLPVGRIATPRVQPTAPIAPLVHQSQIATKSTQFCAFLIDSDFE